MSCAAIVVALGMTGVPAGQAEAAVSEKSVRFYDKAQDHVKKGDLNAAVIQLKNAIRSDANNVDARVQLASIYLAQGDPQGAEKEFKAARARGYDSGKIVSSLAEAYIVQGKFQDLLDDFQDEQLDGEPQAMLSIYRAQAYVSLKQYDEAEKALEGARAINPDMPEIYMVSSWLRRTEGDLAGAEALVDVVLKSSPDSLDALMQKADLRRIAMDNEGAIEFATRALEQNQFRRAPRVTRGMAYAALGQFDNVLSDAEVLLERNEHDPIGAFLKAWGYAQKGEVETALAALALGQGLENFQPAQYLGAALHLRSGALQQARVEINRYLSVSPNNKQALITSSAIYYQAGDYQASAEVLEPLYQADPQDVRIVTLLAYAYEKTGDQGKAAALFDEAINLGSGDQDLQLRAAQAKIGSGDLESGMADLISLTGSESGGDRAATLLFLTQLRAKDFEGAASALDRLETLKGRSAETENFRASLALASGDVATAEAHLKSSLALQDDYQAARLNLARLYRTRKDLDGATAEYEKLLQQQPGYLAAVTGLVEMALERQDEKEIVRLVNLAVKENPENERAHLLKVQQLISLGRKDKALTAARNFVAALPESPAAYDALARGQVASGDVTSAIVTYRQLVARVPDNAVAHFRLAQVLITNGDYTDAMFALEKTLALDPSSYEARQQRIDMEQKVHGNERALVMARKLFAEAPGESDRELGLGRALIKLGRADEGLELIAATFEEEGGGKELVALYQAYDLANRPLKAIEAMVAWVEAHPEAGDIQLVVFSRFIGLGYWGEAIRHGEMLHKANPKNVVILNNLAWVYEKVGRIEEAMALAKQATESAPGVAEIADTYGWILFEHGDAGEAEAVLAEAAGVAPENRIVQFHHAAALAKIGQKSAAVAKLKALLADGSEFEDRAAATALLGELE